jgi:lipopolysaccharide/colanic/teichoic acid biosynthesis glycosyltransferase
VLPGVTGWAQISGRNQLRWPERIELDVWYVDHQSLRLDLRILVATVPELFRGGPVYNDAQGDWGERG